MFPRIFHGNAVHVCKYWEMSEFEKQNEHFPKEKGGKAF